MKTKLTKLILAIYVVFLMFPFHVFAASNYVASKNSNVYHKSNCSYVDQILDKNKIWFDSTAAAEKTGRRGCSQCKPQSSSSESTSKPIVSEKRYSYADLVRHEKESYKSGYSEGEQKGYQSGYDIGYKEGYTAKESEYNSYIKNAEIRTVTTSIATFILTSAAASLLHIKYKNYKQTNNIPEVKQIWHKDGSLYVIYKSGNLFKYDNVSSDCYSKLCHSSNKSKFMVKNIIGRYRASQVK